MGANMCVCVCVFIFFFFNDTATTEIYTLSLHDGSSDLITTTSDVAEKTKRYAMEEGTAKPNHGVKQTVGLQRADRIDNRFGEGLDARSARRTYPV